MATITLRENTLLAYTHQEPEFLPMISDVQTVVPTGLDYVNERPSIPERANDWFGQSWDFEPNIGAHNPTPGVHLIENITLWRDIIRFPDLSKLDWENCATADTAHWDREHRLTRVIDLFGPWERMFSVMEFQEALISLVQEPEACYEFFGAIADHKIRLHNYIIKYYRPDVLVMHDDYGHGKGMFMSPDTWRRLISPHLQRIIDSATSQGVIYEHHCCGYFAPIVGEIADMGCTATNLMHKSNDPANLKRENGNKMCYIGAGDTQYLEDNSISEEEIRTCVRKTLDEMTPGGSFITMYSIKTPGRSEFIDNIVRSFSTDYYRSPRPDANI